MSTIWASGQDLWFWRQWACQKLQPWASDSQALNERLHELDWLLMAVANLDRLALRLETFKALPQIELTRSLDTLSQIWEKRLNEHVPLQYLLENTAWRDFTLRVAPGVLIPRPETELLIDLAKDFVADQTAQFMNWADLGTGSGAISLGLARTFSGATIHAVDCSEVALAIAQDNVETLGLTERIQFWCGQWLEPLAHLKGQMDGIISNPPYIPSAMVPTLQPEVTLHEPHLALDGGEDGLTALRTIVAQAPTYLRSGGVLFLEMMMGQAEAVVDLLHSQGSYCAVHIHSDLAGIQRFAQASRR
jgi:release factor glutamine methyltransferase